jgi:competence protein ComGC
MIDRIIIYEEKIEFTLVELLVVIALIAVPTVLNIVENHLKIKF